MIACVECGRFFACETMGTWVLSYRMDRATLKPIYEAVYRADKYGCKCFTVLTEFGKAYSQMGESDFDTLVTKILTGEYGEFFKINRSSY